MANAAILVGNIEYQRLSKLECCRDDLLAIKQLLEATEKYEEITIIENTEADPLKSQLRAAVDKVQSPEELLFYFTGHGHMHQDEFSTAPPTSMQDDQIRRASPQPSFTHC